MSDLDATRAYYDEFSNWYERDRGRGYHALIDDLEYAVAEPYARARRVLEVGCGTGLILHRLARVASSAKGIDLSPGMLERARKRGLDVREASATEIPFEDGSFDLVCSFKVLAHIQDIDRALAEMARVTARGGVVLAEFYNPASLRYLSRTLRGPMRISARTDESAVYTRYDRADQIVARAPAGTRCEGIRGVRVVTPFAPVVSWPVVGRIVRRAEFALLDSSLARFGGFVIGIYRKQA